MANDTRGTFLADTFRKFVGGLGWLGAFLVAYSVISEVTGQTWGFLETWGPPASIFLTIVGALLTAASIYFYKEHPNPPEKFSLWVSAPFVIAACLIALWFLFARGTLPVMLTNGLAILGLAGGLFQIQVNPGLVR